MKHTRRPYALFLALALVLSAAAWSTTPARATDSGTFTQLDDKIQQTPTAGKITLDNDYTYSSGERVGTDGITINKDITIDLNGHVIDGAGICSCIFTIRDNATVTLEDGGTVTHYYTLNGNGVAVLCDQGTYESADPGARGFFTGACITGCNNESDNGGGSVFVGGSCLLIMEGGTILGNTAIRGGGVFIAAGDSSTPQCAFEMTGGAILGNSATYGGGVYVDSGCVFTMKGGSITGNKAKTAGGGVYVKGGSSSSYPGGINVSGGAVIGGNTDTAATPAASNVYLAGSGTDYDAKITIDDALSSTASIGVTMQTSGVFTSGFDGKGSAENFSSDSDDYPVVAAMGELMLATEYAYYLDAGGTEQICTSLTVVTDSTAFEDGNWYAVSSNVTYGNIDAKGKAIHLILCDGCTLTAGSIDISNSGSLTVYAGSINETISGTGELTVSNATGNAVSALNGGAFTMNGGVVTLSSQYTVFNDGGALTVNGGSFTACATGDNQSTISADTTVTVADEMCVKAGDSETTATDVTDTFATSHGQRWVHIEKAHIHDFAYAASGATITATCGNTGCELTANPTLTIVKPTLTTYGQTGDSISAAATLDALADFNTATGLSVAAASIQYYKANKSGTTYTKSGTALNAAPTGVGDYVAEITVGTGTNTATATVGYSIAKADPAYTAPTNLTATYGQTLADVTLPTGWTWADSTTSVGNVGSNTFQASFTPTDTANYNTVSNVDVTVTVGKAASPATVTGTATVTRGGNTVDLADNVTLNGAAGTVSYAISGETIGCTLSGSILTSGSSAGSVTVNVSVAEDDNYEALAATPITVTISEKQTQTISAENVTATYGDTDKSVSASVTDPTTGGGTISYAVKSGSEDSIDVNASTGALTIKAVPADGKAYVTVTAAETLAYAQASKDVTVNIAKGTAVPAAVTANNRTADKTEKALVTVDASALSGGTMQYALGTDAATAPTAGWGESVPAAAEAGTYYVWYKAVGDANHFDSDAACVTATILAPGAISATVTFKVVNGAWDDATAADKTVTLTGVEGDTLKLAATDIPAVGMKPGAAYKTGSWNVTPSTETAITGDVTYTYTYAQKDTISVTVTFKVVNGTWGDDTREDKTVVLTGYEGDELRLAMDDVPDVTKPDVGYEYKSGTWTPAEPSTIYKGITSGDPITEDTTYTFTYGKKAPGVVDLTEATVTVDTAKKTVAVTLENDTIPQAGYALIFFAHTAIEGGESLERVGTDFPTKPGSYIATVTGIEDAGYTGAARSAVFTVSKPVEPADDPVPYTPSEPGTPASPEPETVTNPVFGETVTAADGSTVTTEMETSTTTTNNADGSVTVTDKATETVTTENDDGSKVETKTETVNAETTDSTRNTDGSVTDTTKISNTETVTETATDAYGGKTITETKTEQEQNTAVTTKNNTDGSVSEKTETTGTEKVTTTLKSENGTVLSETVTETTTETKTDMTTAADGTATGTSTTTTTVKDDKGNTLSTAVTEAEITVKTDENGKTTTETVATTTTTDAEGNKTVDKTVTTENKTPDGSTGTTVTDENGNVLSREVTISPQEAEAARNEGRPIQSPMSVDPVPVAEADSASPVVIRLPSDHYDNDGDGIVSQAEMPKVEIPVPKSSPGIIAMIRDAMNKLLPVKECYMGSVIVPVYGSQEIVIVDNTKTFEDVAEDSWYYEYVTFVTAREIFNGTGDGCFGPNGEMNRAMLAQVLYSFHRGAQAGDGTVFDDVKAGDWFSAAIGWAYENKIVNGYGDSFGAADSISRQDLATTLYRYAKAAGYDVSVGAGLDSFPDGGDVADYAVDAMQWAVGLGLIGGMDDGTLRPMGFATRAQVAAIMTRFVRSAK